MILLQRRAICGLVMGIAVIIAGLFFYFGPTHLYHAITQAHAHVGFNIVRYNSIWLSNDLSTIIKQQGAAQQQLYNLTALKDYELVTQPDQPFPINDTIGYGVLLGLLWKITGSLNVLDAQILQVILYLVSIVLIYHIGLLLFQTASIAWFCVGAYLLFFPLIALAVQPVRDIWAYFATVLLLWGVAGYIQNHKGWMLIGVGTLFSLMQYIRPTVFCALVTISVGLVLLSLLRIYLFRTVFWCITLLVITNAFFFWVPFVSYNMLAYKRPFVGPIGQDLLEGLGEFDNPWGYQLSDEFVARYIGTKYNVSYGSPEFDDKAKEEFARAYAEHPWIYWRNILKRLPHVFVPALPWLFPQESPYKDAHGWQEKIRIIFSSWQLFFDFLLRHVLIRVFLLCGYIGMFLAWRRNYKTAVILCVAIMIGGLGKLPSHIEYRYLVPFYWVIVFFVGYVFSRIVTLQSQHLRRQHDVCRDEF